jgi:hypothetical protein
MILITERKHCQLYQNEVSKQEQTLYKCQHRYCICIKTILIKRREGLLVDNTNCVLLKAIVVILINVPRM